MQISVATANYYQLPFEQALDIIAQAGFQTVELDLFWERKNWAMAQHLRGCAPRDVVRWIHQAGLKVSSIHDGGGVLDGPDSLRGFINPQLPEYLDQLGYAPDCLVFHTPHLEGSWDEDWWRGFSGQVVAALAPFRADGSTVTIENMPSFEGYSVPLITPERLMAFVSEADLGVTLDTTHYAQMGVDITQAARALYGRVNTLHLSDYREGHTHVFVGDGDLNLLGFFRALDASALRAITLECAPAGWGENAALLDSPALAQRLRIAKNRVETWTTGLWSQE